MEEAIATGRQSNAQRLGLGHSTPVQKAFLQMDAR